MLCAGCPDFDRAHQACVSDGRCRDESAFVISPSPITFVAPVGGSARQRVTVTNQSAFATGPLQLSTNDPVFAFEHDGCSRSALAAGASCQLDIAFSSGVIEMRSARLSVSANPGGVAFAVLSGESREAATLTLAVEGGGSGVIDTGALRCSGRCVLRVVSGLALGLSATAEPGSRFDGWSGACSGTGTCELADPTGELSVVALMSPGQGSLTVDVDLDGGAQLRFDPDGTPCGQSCRGYTGRVEVSVDLFPASASGVTSWSGCSATSGRRCTVTVAGDTVVRPEVVPAHVAFVTSVERIPGQLGGVSAADPMCQALATDAGLPGSFVAWLSTAATPAHSRVGAGAWVRPDGAPVADSLEVLLEGELRSPLRLDEHRRDLGAVRVATGTEADGLTEAFFMGNCAGWTSTSGRLLVGGSAFIDEKWTSGGVNFDTGPGDEGCSQPAHFYCFGAGARLDVAPLRSPPGRVAFLSAAEVSGALGGPGGADALCDREARDAGLTGTYFAPLAGTSVSLADRFAAFTDAGWWRVDGVPLGDLATLAGGRWESALTLDAHGRALPRSHVWTGAKTWAWDGGPSCSDWSSDAGTGLVVSAGTTMPFEVADPLNFDVPVSCAETARLWCFER